jgi:hypothetical protein
MYYMKLKNYKSSHKWLKEKINSHKSVILFENFCCNVYLTKDPEITYICMNILFILLLIAW